MGLWTPPINEGGEEGTINVWEASIDSSSQAQKISSCSWEVRGIVLIPLKRSMSLGTQQDQGLQKTTLESIAELKTLYMKRKYCVQITYITVVDHQVRSVVLVVVGLKKGEVRARHAAIVKMMTQR